jgi:hypothetical protein
MHKRSFLILPVLSFLIAGGAYAQDAALLERALSTRPDPSTPIGENLQVPLGWSVRLDQPDESVTVGSTEESDIYFVSMTPGWHITTGPRAILYHPASMAEGSFTARAGIHLFPPGSRNEGFGLFLGGSDLDSDEQQYLYFLIRRSGEFLVKQRSGDTTEEVLPWTRHDAILAYTASSEGTVHNVLEVEASESQLRFVVNGSEVARMPRGDLPVDGIVGLRVNHALNLHVDDFGVELSGQN